MKEDLLNLSIHLMKHNLGSLLLRCGSAVFRIEKMCNALQFVARMKQLSVAIDTGASQDSAYMLTNFKDLRWILNCRFAQDVVALELWMEQLGFAGRLQVPFDWKGSAGQFRQAVNRMIEKMGRYRFFYCKIMLILSLLTTA